MLNDLDIFKEQLDTTNSLEIDAAASKEWGEINFSDEKVIKQYKLYKFAEKYLHGRMESKKKCYVVVYMKLTLENLGKTNFNSQSWFSMFNMFVRSQFDRHKLKKCFERFAKLDINLKIDPMNLAIEKMKILTADSLKKTSESSNKISVVPNIKVSDCEKSELSGEKGKVQKNSPIKKNDDSKLDKEAVEATKNVDNTVRKSKKRKGVTDDNVPDKKVSEPKSFKQPNTNDDKKSTKGGDKSEVQDKVEQMDIDETQKDSWNIKKENSDENLKENSEHFLDKIKDCLKNPDHSDYSNDDKYKVRKDFQKFSDSINNLIKSTNTQNNELSKLISYFTSIKEYKTKFEDEKHVRLRF